MAEQTPPIIPEGHTMTKRQLLQWLENIGDDDPITVYHDGWWLNLVGVDANPDNLTVILETRDDFSTTGVRWHTGPSSFEYPYGKGNQGPGTGPDGERLI